MNRVRLGVIGCGSMSRHHGRIFTQSVPEAEIVALVEPDANNLAGFGQLSRRSPSFAEAANAGRIRGLRRWELWLPKCSIQTKHHCGIPRL